MLRPVRSSDGLASRKRHQRRKPRIDPDAFASTRWRDLDLDVEDDIPFAVLSRQDGRLRHRRERPVPLDLHLAGNANESESPTFTERQTIRSEEHTSELQSLMRISYAVFCLHKQQK